MSEPLALLAVLAVVAVAAALLRRREGAVRPVDGSTVDLGRLGVPPGTAAFVEFTAPGCASCSRAGHVLRHVVADRTDVVLVTVDVGDQPELARAHGVLRAPTTLLVDAVGEVTHRIAGVPDVRTATALLDGDRPAAA